MLVFKCAERIMLLEPLYIETIAEMIGFNEIQIIPSYISLYWLCSLYTQLATTYICTHILYDSTTIYKKESPASNETKKKEKWKNFSPLGNLYTTDIAQRLPANRSCVRFATCRRNIYHRCIIEFY